MISNPADPVVISEPTVKVMGVMTKLWDYQPGANNMAEWKAHAGWLVQAIAERRPRSELDWYMSRVQMHMSMGGSMAFRKIVDRSIEILASPPTEAEAARVEKLNPTTA
jgi:hypothetical protein